MSKSEQQFFEWFDQWQAIADKHDISIYQVVNARQIWDLAYSAGKADGSKEMLDIAKQGLGLTDSETDNE